MFNSISGTLTGKTGESIYIENQGIEWEVFVSILSADRFGPAGSQVKVYTWLYHREDQMRLFGFLNPAERSLFLDLTKVDGIGPKQALKILSGLDRAALETALEEGDVARLQSIPGIGKKTAQKMVLALKGQLTGLQETGRAAPLKRSEFEDVITALADMGYDRKRAAETVEEAARSMREAGLDPAAQEDELFRTAIVNLSSS
ncbi:MAG: Holliday junction branch migration protein RuvA [Treponema sp.]